jgi:hypothetical protein
MLRLDQIQHPHRTSFSRLSSLISRFSVAFSSSSSFSRRMTATEILALAE